MKSKAPPADPRAPVTVPLRSPAPEHSGGGRDDEPATDLAAALEGRLDYLGRLVSVLTDFRLTPREARVLVALVQLGSAPVSRVAQLADVERANVYRVLDSLAGRRLAVRAPVGGHWSAPEREEIIHVLVAEEEERLRAVRGRADRMRQLFQEIVPEAADNAVSFVHSMSRARDVARLYDRLISEAESEILVCNKAPYGGTTVVVWPSVVDAVRRGVSVRALYEAHELDPTASEALRHTRVAFQEVGVDGRVLERVPIRMAVFDRRRVLLAMNDPMEPERFPTNLFVDHADFAECIALTFERMWSGAVPYPLRSSGAKRRVPRRPMSSE